MHADSAIARILTITGPGQHTLHRMSAQGLNLMPLVPTSGANRSTVKLTLSASHHADATLDSSSPHTLCSMMFQAR